MLTKIKIFAPALLTIAVVLSPLFVHAQFDNSSGQYQSGNGGGSYQSNNAGGSSQSNNSGGAYTLQNPLAVSSICQLIGLLLKAAIAIGIPIAVLFIVWAGFKFVLARGSPGELTEARSNLIATLIGIAIFLGASLIANVIISTLHQLGVNGVNQC
jgi:hypothetical protein